MRLSAPLTAGTPGLLVLFGKGEGLGWKRLPSDWHKEGWRRLRKGHLPADRASPGLVGLQRQV